MRRKQEQRDNVKRNEEAIDEREKRIAKEKWEGKMGKCRNIVHQKLGERERECAKKRVEENGMRKRS